MTENCAICSSVDGRDFKKMNTVGKPQKGVDLKIDEKTGEILMKGSTVMIGYYKNEELSNKTLRGGWLHTGDKGFLDDDNYLHITGRVADSFKTSKGEYIEPLTLEQYFVNINEIEEVCVVGLGIAQPLCLIQLSEIGKKTSRDIISKMLTETLDTVNSGLVNYKRISTLIVVKHEWTQENGVIGPTQKLKRGAIEELYSKNYSTATTSVDANGLWIGPDQDSVGGGWQSGQSVKGELDDYRIYDRALSAAEVQALYNLGQ